MVTSVGPTVVLLDVRQVAQEGANGGQGGEHALDDTEDELPLEVAAEVGLVDVQIIRIGMRKLGCESPSIHLTILNSTPEPLH